MKKSPMITVDGSAGEGGGQILRSSLALSLVTGQPFRITDIRARRKKPGLLRQHLTAVNAATEVGDAISDGAEMGSTELIFRPEKIRAGNYHFSIGTAGSATLVLQAVLPALLLAPGPSTLVLEGGTHNPLAPPFDFLAHAFLPILNRFGCKVEATLIRPGFYPAGGGRIEITVTPASKLQPVELLSRGADGKRCVTAHIAGLPCEIAERAFSRVIKRMNWQRDVCEIIQHPDERGPGFMLSAQVGFGHVTEVLSSFGEKGVRTEQVADALVDQIRSYLASDAPVGEYLADQLLIYIALAGKGAFKATGLSQHTQTNMEVIQKFLPSIFTTTKEDRSHRIEVA